MAQQVAIDIEAMFQEASQQAGLLFNRCLFLAGRLSQVEAELKAVQQRCSILEQQVAGKDKDPAK